MAEENPESVEPFLEEEEELRPRDVPGFREAGAAGLLPIVPRKPPSLQPGATAERLLKVLFVKGGAGLLTLLLFAELVRGSGMPDLLSGMLALSAGALWFYMVLRWMHEVSRRQLEEIVNGYTTLTRDLNGWSSRSRRDGGMPWDYSGLWILDSEGRVKSRPNRNLEPPGFYPSPNTHIDFELWTGATWTGRLQGMVDIRTYPDVKPQQNIDGQSKPDPDIDLS